MKSSKKLIENNGVFISVPNQHIEKYLDFYFNDFEKKLDYAVLINGKWGSGKTWFIKQYINKLEEYQREVVYVSLNGLRSIEQVESSILFSLYPKLNNEYVKELGKGISSLLKGIKIDITGVEFKNFQKIKDSVILVFDDMERCEMSLEEVFGVINRFVEQDKIKTIILANEEEIDEIDVYKRIKEKTIGTTFEYNEDYESAIDFFINSIFGGDLLRIIEKDKSIVRSVFYAAGYKNLRALRQSLNDFERMYKANVFKDDEVLVVKFLQYYLIFSLEYKAGVFVDGVLQFSSDKEYVRENKGKIYNNYKSKQEEDFYKKYVCYFRYKKLLGTESWNNIILKNIVDFDEIKEDLEKNYFAYKRDKPEWLKLWNYQDLTDECFFEIVEKSKIDLQNHSYTEEGVVKHIFALLRFFIDNKIINDDIDCYESLALDNLKKIYLKYDFKYLLGGNSPRPFDDSWGGYGYCDRDSETFKSFLKKSQEQKHSVIQEKMIEESHGLLESLWKYPDDFIYKITPVSNGGGLYYRHPILRSISVLDFYNYFMKLDSDNRRKIIYALEGRYNSGENVVEEKPWLLELIEIFRNKVDLMQNGIEKFSIREFYLNPLEELCGSLEDID